MTFRPKTILAHYIIVILTGDFKDYFHKLKRIEKKPGRTGIPQGFSLKCLKFYLEVLISSSYLKLLFI